MRHAWILSLIVVGLGTSVLWGQGQPAPQRGHGKPGKIFRFNDPLASENLPEKELIVSSQWNFTKDDALANALEKAREQVQAYVHEQKPPMEWSPKPDFVRHRLLGDLRAEEVELRKKELHEKERKGDLVEFNVEERFRAVEETRELKEAGELQDQHVRETKRVWLKVVINPETWKQIQKETRQVEEQKRLKVAKSRMVFLVKILAGIVVLLLTVCGYIRLDEWSKGYYTKWLKLGAVGCVGAVSWILLWMLIHR
jgi:hypothetical protein